MWGAGRIFAVLVVAGLAAVLAWRTAAAWHPSRERYPVQGVDVAAADGAIEWRSVAADGADFAYAVATVGERRDPSFETNWAGAATAGLRRGAIHVYVPCESGEAQANAFNTTVPRTPDALPAAVAIEQDAGCPRPPGRAALVRELARFATRVESHTGKPILLKLSRGIEREYAISRALPRSVWLVGDYIAPDYAARPWRMWQANDSRTVEGADDPLNWSVVADAR